MKQFLLTLGLLALGISPAAALELPDAPNGYILDQAELLSASLEAQLESDLTALQELNGTQIAIVTVDSLQDTPIETYALELGRDWGVGQQDLDNGIVFLIAPNEREARIEVGYGLEGAIPDALAFQILDLEVLPNFRADDYELGIQRGTQALIAFAQEEPFDWTPYPVQDDFPFALEILGFILLYAGPVLWAFLSWLSSSKSWWLGGLFGGLAGFAIFQSLIGTLIPLAIGLGLDYFLSTVLYQKIRMPKTRGGYGRGGRSGGGGGFGGFGGGSFGGGGSSGSW